MGAFDDYTALKATLAGYLHRADLNSTAQGVGVDNVVAAWITLFEAEANARLRLRTMESDESLTLTSGTRSVALPTGFIEPLGLWITYQSGDEPEPLGQVNIGQLPRGVDSGPPQYWAIDGTTIKFDRLADQNYALTFRMLEAFGLTADAPTNWLLTNYPNLYLYGALRHSPGYIMQDQRGWWERQYLIALELLEAKEARSNAGVILRTDPALRRRGRFNINRG